MKFEDVKKGMLFRKNSPPGMVYISNKKSLAKVSVIGLYGDEMSEGSIDKFDWDSFFRENVRLVDISDMTSNDMVRIFTSIFGK